MTLRLSVLASNELVKLQTKISVSPEKHPINYDSKILLLGSCFAENVGEKLEYFKFQLKKNPFGIIFNPVSLETLVTRAINSEEFDESDVFHFNERWNSYQVHSSLSAVDKEEFLKLLNGQLNTLREAILNATHIVLTYGTAWVYRHIETDAIVANCHKVPQKKFLKELLSPEAVSASVDNIMTLIRSANPSVVFVHTVSPVRHTKDGMVENARSKAHLLAGVHEHIEPRNRCYYFPAYEIMTDELRDYRFYAKDLVHPNETAISIIWERFSEAWIDPKTQELREKIALIQNGLAHVPFNPESDGHKAFTNDLNKKIEAIREELPHVRF